MTYRRRPYHSPNRFSSTENHERGNTSNAVSSCGIWTLVDVQSDELDSSIELIGELVDGRRDYLAGAAPVSIEICEYQFIGRDAFLKSLRARLEDFLVHNCSLESDPDDATVSL